MFRDELFVEILPPCCYWTELRPVCCCPIAPRYCVYAQIRVSVDLKTTLGKEPHSGFHNCESVSGRASPAERLPLRFAHVNSNCNNNQTKLFALPLEHPKHSCVKAALETQHKSYIRDAINPLNLDATYHGSSFQICTVGVLLLCTQVTWSSVLDWLLFFLNITSIVIKHKCKVNI